MPEASKRDCLSKLVDLEIAGGFLIIPQMIQLNNLTQLRLKGNTKKQNLEHFGKRLIGLQKLDMIFKAGCSNSLPDTLGLIELLPKTLQDCQINGLNFDLSTPIISCPMSYALYYQPSLVSKSTVIEFKTLVLDADLQGLEKFPTEFFTNVVAKGKNWEQIKNNFRVIRQSMPILKAL